MRLILLTTSQRIIFVSFSLKREVLYDANINNNNDDDTDKRKI